MTIVQTPTPLARLLDLRAFGARTAVVSADGETTYAELADLVDDYARDVLGPTRRLVMIEGANRLDSLVAYLAAIQQGHVALLVPDADPGSELVAAYDPDVVVRRGEDRPRIRREGSVHDLHRDLALLLSTSGSTGSPKLVRLSHENLRSNAASIAMFLRIRPEDRAATSLPMHYCYGLSVVHSHLVAGASLLLTEKSVLDGCFWDEFDRAAATSFAGVPYTFELLDRSGFAQRAHPSLRYVTQAGGAMGPGTVRRYAALAARDGWELVVMYGATEATARMAYLPAHLAATRPEAIGMPIPGGSLRIDPLNSELVYEGPNVMLGYAESPADLALGRTVTELRTGDLARVRDGLFEITGRTARHAKLFGLRIDLDRLEAAASTRRTPVWCVADDTRIFAFTTRRGTATVVRERVAAAASVPAHVVSAQVVTNLPRTASGKPDRQALAMRARQEKHASVSVRDEFAVVLGRRDVTDSDSFAGLGGDSLSYVELATRLSRQISDLPANWHAISIGDLASAATGPRTRWVGLDTTVVLRALAILAIVGSHTDLLTIMGGAHVLLAVAGFNLARFSLGEVSRRTRVRNVLASVAQVAVPSALFIGAVTVVSGFYSWPTAVFLNQALGSDTWTDDWQFWFLEALIWGTLGVAALIAIPAFDRFERRQPFLVALAVVSAALVVRFAWVGVGAGPTERYTIGVVAWCLALGWLCARAVSLPQRALCVLVSAVGILGFFGDPYREAVVVGGVAILALAPAVRVPAWAASPIGVVGGSSLFVYLTHWQVYPHLEPTSSLLAMIASFAVGIGAWRLARPALRRLRTR